ncbi:MAG TPA: PQQ-binding-like beta-propeller repeat protein, partial [Ilumatobacter sp.]
VEAIDAATGDVLWSHPVEEGTPIAASESIVLVGSGGPYALSTDVEPGASLAEATMRALDPRTGEERWSQDLELVPGPPGQYSPSVVGTTVIVPHLEGTTDFLDAETGALLRNERIAEHLIPLGAVLLATEPLGMGAPSTTPLAIIEPRTGNRSTPPPGIPVYTMGQQTLPDGSGVLMSSDPPVGPSAKLWLLDESTGAERWSIPFQPVIGRSKDHVVVSDGPVVRVLSAVDGEVVSEFELPTDRGGVLAAAVGDEQVVLAVQSFSGPQGAPTQSEPPDCTGGTTLLDTTIEGEPLTIVEATEGDWFCATTPEGTTFGPVPAAPTAEPAFDQMSPLPGDGAWYTIIVPEGFGDDVRAVDERGQQLTVASGRAADYLILIQPHIGYTDQFPAMADKNIELRGADGALLARLMFNGFASEDVAPVEQVEYPDFVACVNEHGVELELPTVSGPLPGPGTPAAPEQLAAAWSACRDTWIAVQRYQMQGGNPEFLEQRLFLDDCLAEAGFYTMMNQPMDVVAYPPAYESCRQQSPGVIALADCLEQAGLEREGDGQIRGGPYPPELSSAAWQACRRIVVTSLHPPMMSPPQFIAAFDCAAEQGWIIPAMGDTPTPPQLPNDVRTACVQLP